MKKEWLILPICLVLLARIVFVRPQLLDWKRFRTEASPWALQNIYKPAALPVFAINGFEDRMRKTIDPTQPSSFYRNHASRDGVTDETLATELVVTSLYPNLNVGEHSASKASPAVDATGIYVGGDTGWFFGFNLDGSVRWKFHVDQAIRGVHSTALLYQGRVCIGAYNATFYCLDKRDGSLVWTMNMPNGGYGASPLVVGDDLISAVETNRPANGFLFRVSLADGHVIWKSQFLGDQPHSSPALDLDQQNLFVGANDRLFFKVRAKDGLIAWSVSLGGEIKGSPVIGPDGVYVASWSKRIFALDKGDGHILWSTDLHGISQSSATLFASVGRIVIGDSAGYIYGIDAKTGRIAWEKYTGFEVKSSALAAKTGASKWAAWMACGRNLFCAIDPVTGYTINQISLPGSLTGVPVDYKNEIYLALNYPGGLVKLSPVSHLE